MWSSKNIRGLFCIIELLLTAVSVTIGMIGIILSSKSLLIIAGISFLTSLLINTIIKRYDERQERVQRERKVKQW